MDHSFIQLLYPLFFNQCVDLLSLPVSLSIEIPYKKLQMVFIIQELEGLGSSILNTWSPSKLSECDGHICLSTTWT